MVYRDRRDDGVKAYDVLNGAANGDTIGIGGRF
jgi:hypothetical protein